MKNPLLNFLIKFAPDTGASGVSGPGEGSALNEPTAGELAAFEAMSAELAASEAGADDSQESALEGESGAGNDEEATEDPDEDTQPGDEEEGTDGPGDGQQAKEGEESPAKPEGEAEAPAKPEEVDLANVDPDTIGAPKAEEFNAAVGKWQQDMVEIDRQVDGRVGQRVSVLRSAEVKIDAALKQLEDSLYDEELGKHRSPTLEELDRRTELRSHKSQVRQQIHELEASGEGLKQQAKNELTIASMAKADKRFQHPGIAKAHRAAVEDGIKFKSAEHCYLYCKAAWIAENGGKPVVKPDVAGARRAAEEAAIKRKAAGTIGTGAKGAGSSSKSKAGAGGVKSSDPAWVRNIVAQTARLKKEVA